MIKDFHFPWFTLSHLCLPNMVIRRGEDGGADVGGSVGGGGGATFGLRGGGQLSNARLSAQEISICQMRGKCLLLLWTSLSLLIKS